VRALFTAVLTLTTLAAGACPSPRIDPLIERTRWLADRLAPEHPLVRTLPQVTEAGVPVTIRTSHVLSEDERGALRTAGVSFDLLDGRVSRVGRIYPAHVSPQGLCALSKHAAVEWVETVWAPFQAPTLEHAGPEIEATQLAGAVYAATGLNPGQGVVIGNMDQGVDIHHPGLFRADAGAHDWVDTDGDGALTPGVDTVMLDGEPQPLSFIDTGLHHSNSVKPFGQFNPAQIDPMDGAFDPRFDWLYIDEDGDGQRDFGPDHKERPAFGEPLFVLDDLNANGAGDPGERLLRLGTSKVKGIRTGSQAFLRDENLVESAALFTPATVFHGTGSSGILLGGHAGPGRYAGPAHAADLLLLGTGGLANQQLTNIDWARQQGLNVLLIEFGRWSMQFADGSSNLEQAFDALSADGIAVVVPSGNLGNRGKHVEVECKKGYTDLPFEVPGFYSDTGAPQNIRSVVLTLLWRTPKSGMEVQVVSPTGGAVTFVGLGGTAPKSEEGWLGTGDASVSARGTTKLDIILTTQEPDGVLPYGDWLIKLGNPKTKLVTVWGRVADDISSWNGGVTYKAHNTEVGTASHPSTADTVISVGAYGGRFAAAGDSGPGKLRVYSGRGPRIDGERVLDVVAPDDSITIGSGHTLGKSLVYGGYQVFGGTSGAGPHVAAGVALMQQLDPTLTPLKIREALRSGALAEPFMGNIPNGAYGSGKSRFMSAVELPTQLLTQPDFELSVHPGTGLTRTLEITTPTPEGHKARWDYIYRGTWDTPLQDTLTTDITFDTAGTYTVKAELVAPTGARAAKTLQITVEDPPPPPMDTAPNVAEPPPIAPEPAPNPEPTPPIPPDSGCASHPAPAPPFTTLMLCCALLAALKIARLTPRHVLS